MGSFVDRIGRGLTSKIPLETVFHEYLKHPMSSMLFEATNPQGKHKCQILMMLYFQISRVIYDDSLLIESFSTMSTLDSDGLNIG